MKLTRQNLDPGPSKTTGIEPSHWWSVTGLVKYSNIRIGPVVKKDVMKASTMLEHEKEDDDDDDEWYLEAVEIAGLPNNWKNTENFFVFNSRDPIVVGVMIEGGIVREGTPICVPSKEPKLSVLALCWADSLGFFLDGPPLFAGSFLSETSSSDRSGLKVARGVNVGLTKYFLKPQQDIWMTTKQTPSALKRASILLMSLMRQASSKYHLARPTHLYLLLPSPFLRATPHYRDESAPFSSAHFRSLSISEDGGDIDNNINGFFGPLWHSCSKLLSNFCTGGMQGVGLVPTTNRANSSWKQESHS
uniref:Uncharacterized protein n=1 Tax=Timema poppense TaxID=170557 RepID=A0A7R9CL41_TIMPO|nr:unnamed protein product [Timema poppensis]